MDPAPSSLARDRAERVVFDALPDLGAVPRRALALAVLAEVPRAGIASEVGLAGTELSCALAAGRKALRRTRAQLGSGGRCERAEVALSDRLDGAATPLDARFLESHLARCVRCRTHETELAGALQELRAQFAAPPEPVAPPQPPAVESAPPRARLRVVPAAPMLPPAPAPPALEPARIEPEAPTLVPEPIVAQRPAPTPTHVAVRRNRSNPALPVAVAALLAVGLIAAAIALLMHFNKGNSHARAPWDRPGAPLVHPAPISGQ